MEPDPENANYALLLLGITRRYRVEANDESDRLKLEPWAVQAALRRRRGGARPTAKEIKEIRRTTWDPDTLILPQGTQE